LRAKPEHTSSEPEHSPHRAVAASV
jgi:hypothetical protein